MPTSAIDFSIKPGTQGYGGLTMCLCPGTYQGEESFLNSMVIHEAAFGPLEEIIEKHSPQ